MFTEMTALKLKVESNRRKSTGLLVAEVESQCLHPMAPVVDLK